MLVKFKSGRWVNPAWVISVSPCLIKTDTPADPPAAWVSVIGDGDKSEFKESESADQIAARLGGAGTVIKYKGET
jgi:hypothetical protein